MRKEYGSKVAVADLTRVSGISSRTLNRLAPFVKIGEPLERNPR